MTEVQEFECLRCGECCRDIGMLGGAGKAKQGFIGDLQFSLRAPSLIIYEWEKGPLGDAFEKAGSGLLPYAVIYDAKGRRSIVTAYTIGTPDCPHLLETGAGCGIYDTRPHTCRAFPFISRIDFSTSPPGLEIRPSKCKSDLASLGGFMQVLASSRKAPQVMKNLHLRYRDMFEARLFTDFYLATIGKYLETWTKKGHINPARPGVDEKKLRRKIDRSRFVDLSDLVEKYYGLAQQDHMNMLRENCREMLESLHGKCDSE